MKFYVVKTSNRNMFDGKEIEINTLEELITFLDEAPAPLILDGAGCYAHEVVSFSGEKLGRPTDCKYSIEIYDDYRERKNEDIAHLLMK